MNVRTALLIYILVQLPNVMLAQIHLKNAVFGELGGNAYSYSVNYERQSPKGFTVRGGLSYGMAMLVMPVMVGKLYGKDKHHFEISVGADLVYSRFVMNG